MASLLTELLIDETQYVEILSAFNDRICIPTYRSASEYGLQTKALLVLSSFDRLKSLHISLLKDLRSISNDSIANANVNKVFARYIPEFNKTDLDLADAIYDGIKSLFQLSSDPKIMNNVRKLNYESSFNDIEPQDETHGVGNSMTTTRRSQSAAERRAQTASLLVYYKEEPQFIAYILYLGQRVHRYMNYYEMECLVSDQKMFAKSQDLAKKLDSALYLLCLESQISQCQIKIFIKNRVLVRLERLNMEAGKFKKKQKKRLLVLFNDRILWCSILPNATKNGEKYKYKGSFKIKNSSFQIKPFYYDNTHCDGLNDDDESMYGSFNKQLMGKKTAGNTSQQMLNTHHHGEVFGFKFGTAVDGNEKAFKMIVCSENQQQFWCKDINKCIAAPNITRFRSSISMQNIDLLAGFLKHATSWNRDKIWSKIFDAKSIKSLLPIILSLFSDLLMVQLQKQDLLPLRPPPIPLEVPSLSNTVQPDDSNGDEDASVSSQRSVSYLENPVDPLGSDNHSDSGQSNEVSPADENAMDGAEEHEVSISNQSHRSSLHDLSEASKLRQDLDALREELSCLQSDYRKLQSQNAKLSARNVFLANRLQSYSKILESRGFAGSGRSRRYSSDFNDVEMETAGDVHTDFGNENDEARKCMSMITGKRKNSDSSFYSQNKSPSFLSALNDPHIDKDEFYLETTAGSPEEKQVQSQNARRINDLKIASGSRDEIAYSHKRKPKKRLKHRKHKKPKRRTKISHRAGNSSASDSQNSEC